MIHGLGKRTLRFRFEDGRVVGDNDETKAGNQWLVIESIPDEFIFRFHTIPNKIFVRQSYQDIYELVTKDMLNEDIVRPAFIFTGVPGIGKSIFLVYFLCRYIRDDRFPDKRFALEFERGVYDYFTPTKIVDVYKTREFRKKEFHIKEVLVLSDISEMSNPDTRGKWLLLFCSPNPLRYKQAMKILPFFYYVLPVWSYDELLSANENEEVWSPMYERCGGVVRSVFCPPNHSALVVSILKKKIVYNGRTAHKNFVERNFGAIDVDNNYELVHISPRRSSDGKYMYLCANYEYTFASMYVFRKLMIELKTSQLREFANWFNSGDDFALQKYGASFAGDLFVWFCLFHIPLSGRKLSCISLNDNQSPLGLFEVPEIELISTYWIKEGNLKPNVLYVPKVFHLKLGDAVCAIEVGGKKMLLILQTTIADAHPISANDLVKIFYAFPESVRKRFHRKIILFITPFHGKLQSLQPLWTVEGKVFQNVSEIPTAAQNFEQWLYGYELVEKA